MKRWMQIMGIMTALIITLGCYPPPSLAALPLDSSQQTLTVEERSNPNQPDHVFDAANLFQAATIDRLNQIISQFERQTPYEIAVVTVEKTRLKHSPKELATTFFRTWGNPQIFQNNGVLLFISQADRHLEMITGRNVRDIFPDAEVQTLIDTQFIPNFRNNSFDQGTITGIKALAITLESLTPTTFQPTKAQANTPLFAILGAIAVLLVIFFLILTLLPAGQNANSNESQTSSNDFVDSAWSDYSDSGSSSGDAGGGDSGGGGGDF